MFAPLTVAGFARSIGGALLRRREKASVGGDDGGSRTQRICGISGADLVRRSFCDDGSVNGSQIWLEEGFRVYGGSRWLWRREVYVLGPDLFRNIGSGLIRLGPSGNKT